MAYARTNTVFVPTSPEALGVETLSIPPVITELPLHTIVQIDPRIRGMYDLPEMWDVVKEREFVNQFTSQKSLRRWLEPTDSSRHRAMLEQGSASFIKLPHTMQVPVELEQVDHRSEGLSIIRILGVNASL